MRTIKFLILTVSLLVFFTSCKQKKDWKATQDEGTIDAYIEFCEKYPDSEHKAEIKDFLTEFIEDNKNEMYVLYDNFRLREEPYLDAEPIAKMNEGVRLEIMQKSKHKDQITIAGNKAYTHWFKVKTEKGELGWTFGAGFGCSEEAAKACKLFIDQFPDKNLNDYPYCETTFWKLYSSKKRNDAMHQYHERLFSEAIYADIGEIQNPIKQKLDEEMQIRKITKEFLDKAAKGESLAPYMKPYWQLTLNGSNPTDEDEDRYYRGELILESPEAVDNTCYITTYYQKPNQKELSNEVNAEMDFNFKDYIPDDTELSIHKYIKKEKAVVIYIAVSVSLVIKYEYISGEYKIKELIYSSYFPG